MSTRLSTQFVATHTRRELIRSTLSIAGCTLLPRLALPAGTRDTGTLNGNYFPVHDPCIIRSGSVYHLISTGHVHDREGLLPWRTSNDLVEWKLQGRVF